MMANSGTESTPSTLPSSSANTSQSFSTSDIQTNDYIPAWQTNPQIINQDISFSLRRPRADTMPNQSTSFPYTDRFDTLSPDTAPSTDSDTPCLSLRSRSGSTTNQLFGGGIFNHWIGETLQSPTSPTTTDQLLKEDDGNTIASTLASLGLDGIQERRNLLHASHSYSSLSEASSQSDWHRDMTYGSDSSFIRGSSIATMRLQAQTGRPRALSAVDDRTEDTNPSFHHRSTWLSDSVSYQKSTATHRPFLRSSNSSADLLETIARQRKAANTSDESNSRTGDSIFLEGLEIEMDNNQSTTRSLWLGNLDSSVTAPDLIAIFSKYGTIESIRILPDRECAFVNFLAKEDALRAKDAFKTQMGSRLGNATVKVGFGKPDAVPQQPACGDTVQGPTRALWVGNLPANTTQSALAQVFSNFGTIESVRILTHKTCGFVNFYSPDDAARAKRTLHNKEIMGTATGLVRIGYAKVPALKPSATTPTFRAATPPMDVLLEEDATAELVIEQQQPMYMMADTASDQSLFSSAASERQFIMQEFGQDESDGPMFDGIYAPPQYFNAIPAAPELGQSRKVDIYRLRDVRKRLDTGHVSTKELESVAMECLDELVELCSDYIGNTVVQRLFERCSENTKSIMLEVVCPYLASIGIHKNGTWAAQKIIDTARSPAQIALICSNIEPYVPALLLDQFGNYVVQCCLGLGPTRNQFIFDAIVTSCWDIAQGRFGARAVRATLESPHVTKRQQKYVAATLVQHALLLATNANGALLLIWLLDTSGIPGRYRVLAMRLLPHLSNLCIHKLASLTVLKVINQRQELDARAIIVDAMFFSSDTTLIEEILKDQVHGVSMVQKILSSSYIDLRERQRIADRVKQIIHKLKLQHVQGYKRLVEEINMVMSDSVPSASISGMPMIPYVLNPSFAAALQAKYIPSSMSEDASGTSSSTSDLYTDHIAIVTEIKSSSEDPSHTSAE